MTESSPSSPEGAPPNSPASLQASEMIQNLLEQQSGETVRLGDLVRGLGNRAFGPTIFLCALPEALPLPIAGVSAIVGTPLLIFSAQLLLGFPAPWLPKWLANRSIERTKLERILRAILRYLHRFERLIRPRWRFATTPLAERLLGLLFLILALVIILPIPFGNFLPALAVLVISLGLIEADGLLVILGVIAALVILAVMAGAIYALFSWIVSVLSQRLRR